MTTTTTPDRLKLAAQSWAAAFAGLYGMTESFFSSLNFAEAVPLADVLAAVGDVELADEMMLGWAEGDPEVAAERLADLFAQLDDHADNAILSAFAGRITTAEEESAEDFDALDAAILDAFGEYIAGCEAPTGSKLASIHHADPATIARALPLLRRVRDLITEG